LWEYMWARWEELWYGGMSGAWVSSRDGGSGKDCDREE